MTMHGRKVKSSAAAFVSGVDFCQHEAVIGTAEDPPHLGAVAWQGWGFFSFRALGH